MKIRATFVLWVLALCGIAQAQLVAPQLREGQFVYTIPANFDPPMIGQGGIADLNRAAQKCRYPFYVILVESLPGTGDGDKRAANAVNRLAQDWGQRNSSFDMAKSQIFLLAYNPRKYRFLAGSKFETDLGFRSSAHQPYTDIFARSVASQRKDPKSGIINMMSAVDDYLFDQTDPTRVAQRQEAARVLAAQQREAAKRQAEQDRLLGAQAELNEQITRLDNLLAKKQFLPNDASGYQKSLDSARSVRQQNEPEKMRFAASALRTDADILQNYVEKEEAALRAEKARNVIKAMLIIFAVGVPLVLISGRRRRQLDLQGKFDEVYKEQMAKVTNAAQQYFALYGDRGDLLALTEVSGKTAELYAQVTKEVDDIYIGVEALRQHLESCKASAAQATYFDLRPLELAHSMILSPFDFDTGKVNKESLFDPQTKIIKINPNDLATSLSERFKITVQGWDELKAAIAARSQTAEEQFGSKTLDELHGLAEKHGIPPRWLRHHPLVGDGSADSSLYAAVNALAWEDPLAYAQKLRELKATEAAIVEEMDALVAAVQLARSNRLESEPRIGKTMVDPNDDPVVTFDLARRAEDKLAGLLASAQTVQAVEDQAQQADALYRKAAEQLATIQNAVTGAEGSIASADEKSATATSEIEQAQARFSTASAVHANVNSGFYEAARKLLDEGNRDLEKAKRQLGEQRHLNARNNADRALERFTQASEQATRSIKHCNELDQKKAEYEERLARMGDLHAKYQQQVSRYGGRARLTGFNHPQPSGVVDYLLLLSLLDKTENSWQNESRKAQRAYEEAERQRQAAEEAERQRQAEEERRRRQESYESSSSSSWGGSSGGGYSGGSDSSSGGGFSGGSDSSSGDGW